MSEVASRRSSVKKPFLKLHKIYREIPFRDFFNWDSLHARLNSHYEAWSYKKKKHKKIKAYRKSA